MLRQCSGLQVRQLSVDKCLLLPPCLKRLPNYGKLSQHLQRKIPSQSGLTPEKARTLLENLQYMEAVHAEILIGQLSKS